MSGEPELGGTPAGQPLPVDDTREQASGNAGSARELLIREIGAILAGWGVSEGDDDILAPLANSVAGLLAAGPDDEV